MNRGHTTVLNSAVRAGPSSSTSAALGSLWFCGAESLRMAWAGLSPGTSFEVRALKPQKSVLTEDTAMSVTAQLAGLQSPQAPVQLWVMKDAEA